MLYIFFAYFIVQAAFALGFRTCIHNLEPPDGRGFSEPIKAYFRRKAAALQKINTGRLLKKPRRRWLQVVNAGPLIFRSQKALYALLRLAAYFVTFCKAGAACHKKLK